MSRVTIALAWCLTMPTITGLDQQEREWRLFAEMQKLCALYRAWEQGPYGERVEGFRQWCVGR